MTNYPKLNIGIGGVVLKNNSKVLLVKRKSSPNIWTIPSGYMEIHETIFKTIKRELKEETNTIIKPTGIIGLRQRLSNEEGNNLWIIVVANYQSGRLTPDKIEVSEAKFMALPEALENKITPATKQLLKLLQDNKSKILLPQKNLNTQNYTFFA